MATDVRPVVTSCPMYKQKNLATNKELVTEYGRLYYLWVECYKKHESVKEYYEKIDAKE